MEINRCSRCGSFYVSEGNVCPNCTMKDNKELTKFKNFLEENQNETSLNEISYQTGISQSNLTRFLNYDDFKGFENNFK